eukprot:3498272-Pleurochrysis_carterae.AAC.3
MHASGRTCRPIPSGRAPSPGAPPTRGAGNAPAARRTRKRRTDEIVPTTPTTFKVPCDLLWSSVWLEYRLVIEPNVGILSVPLPAFAFGLLLDLLSTCFSLSLRDTCHTLLAHSSPALSPTAFHFLIS